MGLKSVTNIILQPNTISSSYSPFTPLRCSVTALSVSNLITHKLTCTVLTLSLRCLGPPTHHRATATRPWELRQNCLLSNGCDSECVCKCVPPTPLLYVPGMWRFVWCVSHTLCYQHLCDEHKHSPRGRGLASQMVQCQGAWVWF